MGTGCYSESQFDLLDKALRNLRRRMIPKSNCLSDAISLIVEGLLGDETPLRRPELRDAEKNGVRTRYPLSASTYHLRQ